MLEVVDQHEAQYWDRMATGLDPSFDLSLQRRAVAAAAVLGAEDEQEALALVGVIPGIGEAGVQDRAVAQWLSRLYSDGQLDHPPAVASIEPDMLAEAVVTREYAANDTFLATTLDIATDSQLVRALTVLTRAASGSPELTERFARALDQRLPALVARATGGDDLTAALELAIARVRPLAGAAAVLRGGIPVQTDSRSLASVICQLAVERYRGLADGEPERYLGELGGSLARAATVLAELGRHEEALSSAEEGVEHFRGLVEREPERYLGELGGSLNTTATVLSDLGRHQEALPRAEEGVEHFRGLVEREPERYLADLAGSLNNLSNRLDELGRPEDGLEPIEEAVGHYRGLVEREPERYLADLAMSLNNLSNRLDDLGRTDEALGPAEEAVEHYRRLTEKDPRYLPNLAAALNNLSNRLDYLGRPEAALKPVLESVKQRRALVEQNPERYLADLSSSLNNLSTILDNLKQHEEAAAAIEEAVKHYRSLVERNPLRYLPSLAHSLNNLSVALARIGRLEEALTVVEEALRLVRDLVRQNEPRHRADLAGSLNNLSNRLDDLGRTDEALEPAEEAVGQYRRLAEKDRERYLADLTMALNNFSNRLDDVGRPQEALAPIEEAVKERRALAGRNAERYLPDLAGSLHNLSTVLRNLKRGEEALAAADEAVAFYRSLVEQSRERYLSNLAAALQNRAGTLGDLGREEEALPAVEEAVEHDRWLAKRNPGYLSSLASTLNSLSLASASIGRAEEALLVIEEVLAEHDGEPGIGALLLSKAIWHLNRDEIDGAVEVSWKALQAYEGDGGGWVARVRMFIRRLRAQDPGRFDAAWDQSPALLRPPWLQHFDSDPAVSKVIREWVQTPTWKASREVLEANAELLLSDIGEAGIEHLIDARPGIIVLEPHLRILRSARARGIAPTYREIEEELAMERRRQTLQGWLRLEGEESLQFLLQNSEQLLDEASAEDLLAIALGEPDNSSLFFSIGLLTLAAADSPAAAYEEIDRSDQPRAGDHWLDGDGDSTRTLGLARLRAGLGGQSPDCQFNHAVAAAAGGQSDEARQAAERCRRLLPSWELPDYLRQLDALIADRPHHRPQLVPLKEALSEPSPPPEEGPP